MSKKCVTSLDKNQAQHRWHLKYILIPQRTAESPAFQQRQCALGRRIAAAFHRGVRRLGRTVLVFTWAADQSGLLLSPEERATLGVEPGNLCGWAGARLGRLLVDNSFGVSGILIPVMVVLVGVRVIRQRPLLFNHSILSLFLILILGSLTLGFAFSDKWSLCSSTGWGGAFGIETAALLRTHIGVLGTLILLLGCWILTGVFINRNFINKVNRAGNVMVDKSGKIVEIVKHKVCTRTGNRPMPPGMRLPYLRNPPGIPGRGLPGGRPTLRPWSLP